MYVLGAKLAGLIPHRHLQSPSSHAGAKSDLYGLLLFPTCSYRNIFNSLSTVISRMPSWSLLAFPKLYVHQISLWLMLWGLLSRHSLVGRWGREPLLRYMESESCRHRCLTVRHHWPSHNEEHEITWCQWQEGWLSIDWHLFLSVHMCVFSFKLLTPTSQLLNPIVQSTPTSRMHLVASSIFILMVTLLT